MAYGKYKMGSKRTITGPATPGSGDGEGARFYAGGPGFRELNNLVPGKPRKKMELPPVRRKGPGGGPKPRKPIISRKERQLPTLVKPQGQRRKASDMGKTARNGRPRIRGGR